MIKLDRLGVHLANLEHNEGVKKSKADIEAWAQAGSVKEDKPEVPDFWNRSEVRGALIGQQGLVCAFCQMPLEVVSKETTVDHFYPQEHYPLQTYDWTNLIMVCGPCNSKKGDRLELENGVPKLLNPYEDNLDDCFELVYLEHWPFVSMKGRNSRAVHTVKQLGLDGAGRTSLAGQRFAAIEDFEAYDPTSRRNAQQQGYPFSWMLREHEGSSKADDSQGEAIINLLITIVEMLQLEELNKNASGAWNSETVSRLRYTLAVLCVAHPLKDLIREYFEEFVPASSQVDIKKKIKTLENIQPNPEVAT